MSRVLVCRPSCGGGETPLFSRESLHVSSHVSSHESYVPPACAYLAPLRPPPSRPALIVSTPPLAQARHPRPLRLM
eukprot:4311137-Prymnesium_polylepis.1